MSMQILTINDVTAIHGALVAHFERESDPISPAGVRSQPLLESAVARQFIGSNGKYHYGSPHSNAATLMYGICMNHPFYNGNKRTALVAGLVHLDRNGYIPSNVTHAEIYDVMRRVAAHELVGIHTTGFAKRRRRDMVTERVPAEDEVRALSEWLRDKTRKEDKRERPLTFRQLRRVLTRFDCHVTESDQNFVDIYRNVEVVERRFLGLSVRRAKRPQKVFQLSCAGDGELLQINQIKAVRKQCRLTAEDGIDSRAFYDEEARIDSVLNQYRTVLKRLARA